MGALVRWEPNPVAAEDGRAALLVRAFLSGRTETTLRAYRQDLEDFRVWLGASTVEAASRRLLEAAPGEGNVLALAYRAALLEKGLAPATVNRRLAALRSLVKLGRTLGLVSWSIEVEGVRSQAYRDTKGPGRAGFCQLLEQLHGWTSKDLRDRAVLRLLFDLALRRGEVVSLDLKDLDLEAGTLAVLGKGRTERERLTLPEPTRAALRAWVEARGDEPGPLFLNFDRAAKGEGRRLTGQSVYRLVRDLGDAAGLRVRPHGLRHAAVTEALELTAGDVRRVQRFSRHKKLETLLRYDDNRQDLGGEVAALVAASGAESSKT